MLLKFMSMCRSSRLAGRYKEQPPGINIRPRTPKLGERRYEMNGKDNRKDKVTHVDEVKSENSVLPLASLSQVRTITAAVVVASSRGICGCCCTW